MISEKQRLERLKGIGGSDMAVILGLSSYKTPYQLFLEKTGVIVDTQQQSDFQEWGKRLEPIIRIKFAERNDVEILAPKEDELYSPPCSKITFTLDTIIHPFHQFMRANLDGFIPCMNAVLETKCSNSFMSKKWGNPDTDAMPMEYLAQVAHYVSCVNADQGKTAVLIGGYDYKEFTYKRDMGLESILITVASEFWKCVESNTPPSAINASDLKILYPNSDKKNIKTNAEIRSVYDTLHELSKNKKHLLEMENEYKFQLMQYMKDAECLVDSEGVPLATWKSNKNGTRVFKPRFDNE